MLRVFPDVYERRDALSGDDNYLFVSRDNIKLRIILGLSMRILRITSPSARLCLSNSRGRRLYLSLIRQHQLCISHGGGVGDRSPAPMTMSDTHSTALRDGQIQPLPDVSQRADAIGRWDEACPVL